MKYRRQVLALRRKNVDLLDKLKQVGRRHRKKPQQENAGRSAGRRLTVVVG